jgi:hypothetical protein
LTDTKTPDCYKTDTLDSSTTASSSQDYYLKPADAVNGKDLKASLGKDLMVKDFSVLKFLGEG